jgi:hypothetical protein
MIGKLKLFLFSILILASSLSFAVDTDRDTLPDDWEIANGRDPLVADYMVSAGADHTCAIDDNGLICWGDNEFGQTDIPPLENPFQVSAGDDFTCAIDDSGLICFGSMISTYDLMNESAVGGAPRTLDKSTALQVSAGLQIICAVGGASYRPMSYCVGNNDLGQSEPRNSKAAKASTYGFHACQSEPDGGLTCWGNNQSGQVYFDHNNPNIVDVSVGAFHTCVIGDMGVTCSDNFTPFIPSLENPVQLDSAARFSCALDDNGLVCFGECESAVCTIPDLINPAQFSIGLGYSGLHACALGTNGVTCWGDSSYGKIDVPELFIDPDGDGYSNQGGADAFPFDASEWLDTDSDGTGNNADTDDDGDGVADNSDAFSLDSSEAIDTDSDGMGNNADTDDDNDGVPDSQEISDGTDPLDANSTDTDRDGDLDINDADDDGDGVIDSQDAFPLDGTETTDFDSDGVGDNADNDDDNDGVADVDDAFSLDASETLDTDSDGVGNNTDTDDDGDGVLDAEDAFPFNSSETTDTDGDGLGNNSDPDDDGDGSGDQFDAFPLDASEQVDTDGDGAGDNSDVFPTNALYKADSDSDGIPDAWEIKYSLDPNDPSDADSDRDNDGVTALDEFLAGTIPSGSIDLDGNEKYDALTDGLLLLRGMFGLDGSALVAGAIASDATYSESVDIEARIATLGDLADIDGNVDIDALTDGLLTLRYLFGLQGDTLINGVVADDATRKTAEEIEAHLETLMPAL